MLNWLCCSRSPPAAAAVQESVTRHHAAVVSISGISGPEAAAPSSPDSNVSGAFHSAAAAASATIRGLGVLIHPALVLTTHSTVPSSLCIKDAEITFCLDVTSLTYVKRRFLPDIFFETNVELDLTVVTCEIVLEDPNCVLPLDITKLHHGAICRGHPVFIMGCWMQTPDDIVVMEGRITSIMAGHVQSDALLYFQTVSDGIWMPGSVGFDEFGSFAFIVTRPPAKLRAGIQSRFFEFGNDKVGNWSSFASLCRLLSKNVSAHKTIHLATRLPAIKEWLVAMMELNRNEIFGGNFKPLRPSTAIRRPSTPSDALFRQKSFTPRSNSLTTNGDPLSEKLSTPGKSCMPKVQDQMPPCDKQGSEVEHATLAWHQPVASSLELKTKVMAPSSCVEERLAEKGLGSSLVETHSSSSQLSKTTMSYKEHVGLSLPMKVKTEAPSSFMEQMLSKKASGPAFVERLSVLAHRLNREVLKKTTSHKEDPIQSTCFSAAPLSCVKESLSGKAKTAAPLSCEEERLAKKVFRPAPMESHSSPAHQPDRDLRKKTISGKECSIQSTLFSAAPSSYVEDRLSEKAQTAASSSCVEERLLEKAIGPASIETHIALAHRLDGELPKMSTSDQRHPIQGTPFPALAKQKGLQRLAARAANK